MFYVHPWEIDPGQPRLRVGSRISRWRHYVNLEKTEQKLQRLLQSFRFGRMCDVIERATDGGAASLAQTTLPTHEAAQL